MQEQENRNIINFINKSTNFFEILNIDCNVNIEEITKAYRLLSIKVHPDKNDGLDEATEAFKKLNSAHECLIDEKERKKYHDSLLKVSF